MSDDDGGQVPVLGDVLEYPDSRGDGDRRWIVLYPEDYDNFVRDVEGNVGVLVDIDQTGELLRLCAETLAGLSAQEADGEDVIGDMIDQLEDLREGGEADD